MKKPIAMLLAALLLCALTACAEAQTDAPRITLGTQPDASASVATPSTEPSAEAQADCFYLDYAGVRLVAGEPFDASRLPEPESVYTVPSCAFQGTDNVYNYGALEVTAYDAGGGERIYSVYFLDPNLKTAEGLAQGDAVDTLTQLYGADYTLSGTAYVYTRGTTQLRVIVQGDTVISIEYRMA